MEEEEWEEVEEEEDFRGTTVVIDDDGNERCSGRSRVESFMGEVECNSKIYVG